MLELFQLSWNEISQKMPEIAEAGYDSLWRHNHAQNMFQSAVPDKG